MSGNGVVGGSGEARRGDGGDCGDAGHADAEARVPGERPRLVALGNRGRKALVARRSDLLLSRPPIVLPSHSRRRRSRCRSPRRAAVAGTAGAVVGTAGAVVGTLAMAGRHARAVLRLEQRRQPRLPPPAAALRVVVSGCVLCDLRVCDCVSSRDDES